MLSMLVAYDAAGNIVATLDWLVQTDPATGKVLGLVDFGAHEAAGGEMLDVWQPSEATGSKTWPEWLSESVYDFRVELVGPPGRKRIGALVHKTSGYRRERADVEAAIAARIAEADGGPADISDLVGGPDRPISLDDNGRTRAKEQPAPLNLPLVRRGAST